MTQRSGATAVSSPLLSVSEYSDPTRGQWGDLRGLFKGVGSAALNSSTDKNFTRAVYLMFTLCVCAR